MFRFSIDVCNSHVSYFRVVSWYLISGSGKFLAKFKRTFLPLRITGRDDAWWISGNIFEIFFWLIFMNLLGQSLSIFFISSEYSLKRFPRQSSMNFWEYLCLIVGVVFRVFPWKETHFIPSQALQNSLSINFKAQSKQAKNNITSVSAHNRQWFARCNKLDKQPQRKRTSKRERWQNLFYSLIPHFE